MGLADALPQRRKDNTNEIKVHNQIMDTVTKSISQCFLTHGTLYVDLARLDLLNSSYISPGTLARQCLPTTQPMLAQALQ